MMLCSQCHRQGGCLSGVLHATSYGPCEDCGKNAGCMDCHNFNNTGMSRDDLKSEADRIYAMVDKDAHYWLMTDEGWVEVHMAEFVRAERQAGFQNTQGRPDRPATGGFSSGKMRGAVTFTGDPPQSFEN